MTEFVRVASLADLAENSTLAVEIDGTPVCVVRTQGEVCALLDECSHAEVALQRGDAFGDGLLGDRQVGGGFLELARFRDGDEGTYCFEVHADPP